jgi:hypothetical protein
MLQMCCIDGSPQTLGRQFATTDNFAPFAAIGWRPARVFSHLESKHRQAQHALTERTFFVVRYVKAVS